MSRRQYLDEREAFGEVWEISNLIRSKKVLSGGDAAVRNTRSHPEHDGKETAGR